MGNQTRGTSRLEKENKRTKTKRKKRIIEPALQKIYKKENEKENKEKEKRETVTQEGEKRNNNYDKENE